MKSEYQIIMFSFVMITMGLISTTGALATLYEVDTPALRVVAEEINPEPVEPGQDVTVKIRLTNEGGESAEEVSMKLNAGYPFFIKTESSSFENKRDLCIGCSIENTYYLVVDANAKSGLYPLDFEIYRDNITIKPSDTINIKVVGKPDVLLESRQMNANISSGDKFNINFDARNIGTGIARKIKIKPQSDNILMLGSNINLINEIKPEEAVSFNLEFIVKESLAPDTYKFPIKLEYVDEQGSSYDASFDVGVNVLDRADISFQSIKITPKTPTLADEIHLEGIIENTGTGNADKVTVELISPRGKTYKAFAGQLKADDDSPFYFDAKPESVGMQTATLRVSYYDDFGFHSYETTLDKEIKRPTNNLITILIALLFVGLGAGYFYYKKRKTKKQA